MPDATLEMTITPDFEKTMKGYPFFLEVEMLQGERKDLPNGQISYKIKIQDPEKSEMIREFVLKMISNSHSASKN